MKFTIIQTHSVTGSNIIRIIYNFNCGTILHNFMNNQQKVWVELYKWHTLCIFHIVNILNTCGFPEMPVKD